MEQSLPPLKDGNTLTRALGGSIGHYSEQEGEWASKEVYIHHTHWNGHAFFGVYV